MKNELGEIVVVSVIILLVILVTWVAAKGSAINEMRQEIARRGYGYYAANPTNGVLSFYWK